MLELSGHCVQTARTGGRARELDSRQDQSGQRSGGSCGAGHTGGGDRSTAHRGAQTCAHGRATPRCAHRFRLSREAGFDSHLVKPLDLDRLTQLLATLPTWSPRPPLYSAATLARRDASHARRRRRLAFLGSTGGRARLAPFARDEIEALGDRALVCFSLRARIDALGD
jgi:hypothetical protein